MSTKNTVYEIQAVDAIALMESLKNLGYHSEIKKNKLYFYVSRYAMDGSGYHVGYEVFTGIINLFNKDRLGISGIPHSIFGYVAIPDTLDVAEIEPAINEEEYNQDLDNDSEGVYCASDDDFAYQELEYALEMAVKEMSEAVFDPEERTWSCGNFTEFLD